ncbi:MAG: patatin-like phospholipase family protein [Alphaproteobacteria bacterium]|nr:patatin-like phospholipase family protein [Alphaproteobacteria bacterium]
MAAGACSTAPEAQPVPPGIVLGQGHEEVRAVIEARRLSGYVPGSGSDGNRLCLVVQGGGMRGIVGSAAAVALDQLGIAQTFDAMYGTSAGALTVAYLAAGQIAYGTSIYYQNLAGHGHFIDRWRLSEPMDIGFLFDQWITRGKALDADAVLASPVRVAVSATDAGDGRTRMFDNRELAAREFVSAVRASTSMPLFSDNRETIRGRDYVDGFIGAPVPVAPAVSDGCTHMLILPTSTPETRDAVSLVERIYGLFRMGGFPAAFRDAFARRADAYNTAVGRLYGEGFGIPTMIVAPRDPGSVPRSSETDPEPLVAAAEASLRRVEAAFGAPAGSTRLYFAPEGMQAFPDDRAGAAGS